MSKPRDPERVWSSLSIVFAGSQTGQNNVEGLCPGADAHWACCLIPDRRTVHLAFAVRARDMQIIPDVLTMAKGKVFAGDQDQTNLPAVNNVFDAPLPMAACNLLRTFLDSGDGVFGQGAAAPRPTLS